MPRFRAEEGSQKMGHALSMSKTISEQSSKRFHGCIQEKEEVLHRIAALHDLSEKEQKERFSLLCCKYGQKAVIRLCCDLVVLSSGEEIPLPIWDFATQYCSRTPSIPLETKRQITEKELTRIFRNCIITEKTDGKTFFARKKKRPSS